MGVQQGKARLRDWTRREGGREGGRGGREGGRGGREGTCLFLIPDDHAGGDGRHGRLELVLDQNGGNVFTALWREGREGGRERGKGEAK